MLTFRALSDLFLRDRSTIASAGQLDPQTVSWHRSGLRPLIAALGDRPAAEVAPYEVTAIKFTPNSMQSIRCLYRWAVKQKLIAASQFDGVLQPKYEGRTRMPSEVEARMIRRTIAPRYRWLIWIMRRCGARPGELRNARWSDYNASEHTITLTEFKCKKRRKDKLHERCLFLDPIAARVLSWLRRSRAAADGDCIFPGPNNEPIKKNSLCREWGRVIRKLKLNLGQKERLVCYSIRHGFATAALAKGVPIKELSEMLGHTGIDMTMRYVHTSRASLRAAAATAARRAKPEEIQARPILGKIEGFPRLLKLAG